MYIIYICMCLYLCGYIFGYLSYIYECTNMYIYNILTVKVKNLDFFNLKISGV